MYFWPKIIKFAKYGQNTSKTKQINLENPESFVGRRNVTLVSIHAWQHLLG
jgi:hypothetical protein